MMYGTGGYAHFTYAGRISVTGAPVSISITGVAGVGVARALTPNPAANPIGVAGVGVARGVTPEVDKGLTGVAGIGVAAGVIAEVDKPLTGVAGIGVVGSITFNVQAQLLGVSGTGVARGPTPNVLVTLAPAIGIGQCGQFIANPSGNPFGVSGTGVAGILRASISGGGTSGTAGDGDRRKKPRTGLEPVKKRPSNPQAFVDGLLPLPNFKPARSRPGVVYEPIELVDPDLIPSSLLALQDKIHTAEDLSDVERFLEHLQQDEQDAADIADVLAMLDED